MALILHKLDKIDFGEKQLMPILTIERGLRLQEAKFDTAQNAMNGIEVIAGFFPGEESFVKDCLACTPLTDIYRLQSYLIGGDELLGRVDSATKGDVNA